jgi:hypothetical protein
MDKASAGRLIVFLRGLFIILYVLRGMEKRVVNRLVKE